MSQPYQVMPPLAEPEYEALKASIAAGYDPARPIVVDEDGAVLDGHHRQRICAELGITPPAVTLPGLTEAQKHDYALRANLACRHLSQAQKREIIRAELDRDPGRSDREIGRLCGADHKTVGAVRRGEIPHLAIVPRPVTREIADEVMAAAARGDDPRLGDGGPLTRREAEELTDALARVLHAETLELIARLMAGWPPARVARDFTAHWPAEPPPHYPADQWAEVLAIVYRPRLDAILAWPGGPFAGDILAEDNELRHLYVQRFASSDHAANPQGVSP